MPTMRTFVLCFACLALGVFLGTKEFGGRTALEHLQRGWKSAPSLETVKEQAQDTVDSVKKKFSSDTRPTEHHAAEDKDAVNKLIAHAARK